MKSLTIIGLVFMTISFVISNDNNPTLQEQIKFEKHPDLKLNYVRVVGQGPDGLIVSGEVQYTKNRGSLHGHLDLVQSADSNTEHLMASSGKLSTHRGVMGQHKRYFKFRVAQTFEDGNNYSLRFHANNPKPHHCEC